jgi:CheY-like chemotaxis protein
LSHELRTPLNAIVGWAGVLRAEGVDKATAARAIETIERNAHLQSRLIEDILDVSRIVTGQFKLELEPVDVAAVVLGAVESVRPLAKAKSIALEVAIAPDLGRVVGEASRLQQVVWNLLTNAVKFAGPSGQVSVRLARRDGRAEIRVADDGQGIDPAFLPHVFDAFRQADASTSRRHGGLGLGLAIVRYLVELHGGTCEAESEGLGRGATFTVTLPLQPASPTAEPCGEPPNVASQPAARLDGVRVLLVDDEPDAIDLAATILRAHGAEVLAAASTEEALRIFEQHRPAVVVSDLGMPGRDGFDLLRSIRSLPEAAGAYVPALALSAYARPEERETAIRAGFDEHVAKPFGSADLVAAVSRIAAASSAH